MGSLIKGKPVADKITDILIDDIEVLKSKNLFPKLTIVRVGSKAEDLFYEKVALDRMKKCGILTDVIKLPLEISQDDFIEKLKEINDDTTTHGILIFRPLPKQLDEKTINHVISPEKDVDCFSPVNVAKVMENDETGFPPCTPKAVIEILNHYDIDITGKNVVVIGRSMVVGKPLSMLLLNKNATVIICHSKTINLPEISSKADIVVAAIGRAKMIDQTYLKDNAVVIDVGINTDENGDLCGDVDTDKCVEKCSMITPVPGGVGSVTTTILAKHVVKACKSFNVSELMM